LERSGPNTEWVPRTGRCQTAPVAADRELGELLERLEPELVEGEFVFVTTGEALVGVRARAMVVEAEGYSYVLERAEADRRGLRYDFVAAWITLRVTSALDGVGLTRAVSAALADARISCNVIAGYHHDHLLVPFSRASEALAALRRLSTSQDR
jgi:hypothetical protein